MKSTRGSFPGRASVGVLCVVALVGCWKDDAESAPKVRTLGVRPPVSRPAEPPPADDTAEPAPKALNHVDIEPTVSPPVTYTVTVHTDAGPKAPDPDVAVVEAARAAASQCFTGISDGTTSRFATIHVIVLPSGSVSRTEVSASTTHEDWILSCLDGVGSGLHFSDKPKADIRNFSISVSVSLAH